jgi:transposase
VLLHDNARSHTAAHTWALLKHFNWKLSDLPPYRPDLTMSDYHLFTDLKNWLGSQCFNNHHELKEGVEVWLSSQVVDFFDRHTKTYSPMWHVPQFRQWLCWEVT